MHKPIYSQKVVHVYPGIYTPISVTEHNTLPHNNGECLCTGDFIRLSCGEPAISLYSHTVPLVQWSTRLLPVMRDPVQSPGGILMWNRDSPVSIVSLHWWSRCDWSLWPRLRQASSRTVTRCRADNVIILLDITQLFCPSFTLAAGPPSGFTTDIVGCWRGALWRACNLTVFTQSSTGPVVHPFASRHEGPGFNPQGGYLCETGILLLGLSRYNLKNEILELHFVTNIRRISDTPGRDKVFTIRTLC
jgi:hypothetical protein